MLTIDPPRPASIIRRASCFTPKKTPFRHRSTVKSQSSSVMSTMRDGRAAPATLNAASTEPKRSAHVATSASTSASDGHVARHGGDLVTELGLQRLQAGAVDVTGGDPAALGDEAPGDRPADARRRAGDDGGLSVEAVGHRWTRSPMGVRERRRPRGPQRPVTGS